jgi:hypothetical protein
MLAMDRPGSDDLEVPAARDTARPEGGESGPGRGAVLTDARMRREYALAYRARVEAAYEREEPETARGSADNPAKYTSVVDKYRVDYIASIDEAPRIGGPCEVPEKWIDAMNPAKGSPGRDNNCGECARAVFNTWYGRPSTAAAMADVRSSGEPTPRMSEWATTHPISVTMTEIAQRLSELGPGSSAIIGCDFRDGRGHWFNAVNDAGTVKAVDGQWGKVQEWPPTEREFTFDPSRTVFSEAFFFDREGRIAQ